MNRVAFFILPILILLTHCNESSSEGAFELKGKGALLTTRFHSYEDFEKVIQVEYKKGRRPSVKLTHKSNGHTVTSILKAGISEKDIMQIRTGSIWDKIGLCFRSPYFVVYRQDVKRVFYLSRRRDSIFGWKDVAFYDIAETMMDRIIDVGLTPLDSVDFSEKGYINTFNHISSQAFMTSIYSERFADFIADMHERSTLPALITGDFTEEQIEDVKNGAVDNYIDFINNEWGQELGKMLKQKYDIDRHTYWTPQLMADYLNDMQNYYSRVMEIGFQPFTVEDELVVKFARKINRVMKESSKMTRL
jgi:hypothetical protein